MALPSPQLGFLCDLVYRRSAIVLTPDKEYLVESRLSPLAKARGFASVDALITALRTQPIGALHVSVVEAMTTNETTFFRDQHPFDAVRTHLLPALREARAGSRSLTILSAACSTGQEAYSVAMLLREHAPDLQSWGVRIIGVDLSQAVLAKAREGIYTQAEITRGLPEALRARYFEPVGVDWQLKKTIRDMVEWRQMNLIEPWPALPRVDLLFLRNVLIYFDQPAKKAILERVRRVLAPDGYLFLGGAETTYNVDEQFERFTAGGTTVYRLVSPK